MWLLQWSKFCFIWQLVSKERQEQKVPGLLRSRPGNDTPSFPPHNIGQSNHKTCPDLRKGEQAPLFDGKCGMHIWGYEGFLWPSLYHIYRSFSGFICAVSSYKFRFMYDSSHVTSFNFSNKPVKGTWTPFFGWESWGSERLRNLSTATQSWVKPNSGARGLEYDCIPHPSPTLPFPAWIWCCFSKTPTPGCNNYQPVSELTLLMH